MSASPAPSATTGAPSPPSSAPRVITTPAGDVPVVVVRSKKRKRTVGGQEIDGVLRVTVPSWMSKAEEAAAVADMAHRFRRRRQREVVDLNDRARQLAARYGLPRPREIRWGGDMRSRWGSCTPGTGTIRLCDRLSTFPRWVLDYVIVHELAHLAQPNHSPAFWELVHRYERSERAIGYLIAKSGASDDGDGPVEGDDIGERDDITDEDDIRQGDGAAASGPDGPLTLFATTPPSPATPARASSPR